MTHRKISTLQCIVKSSLDKTQASFCNHIFFIFLHKGMFSAWCQFEFPIQYVELNMLKFQYHTSDYKIKLTTENIFRKFAVHILSLLEQGCKFVLVCENQIQSKLSQFVYNSMEEIDSRNRMLREFWRESIL